MTNPKLFADLAELAGGAAQALSALKKQLRDETRERVSEFAGRFDMVTREDLDRLEGMILKLRTRVDALEKGKGKAAAPAKPAAAKKGKAAASTKRPSKKAKK